MNKMLNNVRINKDIIKKAVGLDFSVSIDVADWLVKILDITFYNSHEIAREIVKLIEEKKCRFDLTELQKMELKLQVFFTVLMNKL